MTPRPLHYPFLASALQNNNQAKTPPNTDLQFREITDKSNNGMLSNPNIQRGGGALSDLRLAPFNPTAVPFARPTVPTAPEYRGNMGLEILARSGAVADKGANAIYGAAAGAVNDELQRRGAYDTLQYQNEMEQYKTALERYRDAQLKARQQDVERLKGIEGLDDSVNKMVTAYRGLEDELTTGPLAGRFGQWLDQSGFNGDKGDNRQLTRFLLKKLQVDQTLLNTANTKGAISDREMALFLSPQPDITMDENSWRKWMENLMRTTVEVRNRLARGETVPLSERVSSGTLNQVFGQFTNPTSFNTGSVTSGSNTSQPSTGPAQQTPSGISYSRVVTP